MKHAKTLAGAMAAAATLLYGCGGGGGSSAQDSIAEGVYEGRLSGGAAPNFQMLVLDAGQYWVIYGTETSEAFYVQGFMQGNASSGKGSFSSANARDFGASPSVPATIKGTYDDTAMTIEGTVSYAPQPGSVRFSGGPIAGSLYDYASPATLGAIAGGWTLTALTGESITLNVAPDGKLGAMSSMMCSMTGNVVPRATGKNVYDVTLKFGPVPCALAGQTVSGAAIAYSLANGKKQLLVAATDASRNYGTAAFGTR